MRLMNDINFKICQVDNDSGTTSEVSEQDLQEIIQNMRATINPHCPICANTKFRAGIECAEWAKMNANLNGGSFTIACPLHWLFRELTESH